MSLFGFFRLFNVLQRRLKVRRHTKSQLAHNNSHWGRCFISSKVYWQSAGVKKLTQTSNFPCFLFLFFAFKKHTLCTRGYNFFNSNLAGPNAFFFVWLKIAELERDWMVIWILFATLFCPYRLTIFMLKQILY